MSLLISRPSAPISAAASKPVSPAPAPSSSRVWPGCGASARSSHSRTGVAFVSMYSRRRSQPGATASAISRMVRRCSSSAWVLM